MRKSIYTLTLKFTYINLVNLFVFLQDIKTFIKEVYKKRYNVDLSETKSRGMYSFAVSIFAVGGMLGGFSGGMIANRFGR